MLQKVICVNEENGICNQLDEYTVQDEIHIDDEVYYKFRELPDEILLSSRNFVSLTRKSWVEWFWIMN